MSEPSETSYQVKNSLITASVASLFSALSAAITIAFLLGGANKDISNILERQQEQTIVVRELSTTVAKLDKTQSITNVRMENTTKEIERLRLSQASLYEDMKCIRIAAASNGDITKC